MHQQLGRDIKFSAILIDGLAAGTDDTTNGASVDMAGYEGVIFVAVVGDVTATGVYTLHVETSSDDSTFNDLEGTSTTKTTGDSDELLISEIHKPRERYLRPVQARATANIITGGVFAIQYGPAKTPVTQDTTVTIEHHVSPAEGTI